MGVCVCVGGGVPERIQEHQVHIWPFAKTTQ